MASGCTSASQAGISARQVRALETELRETLLIRTGRGVTLTDAGRRLLEHGHAIMQRVTLAKEDLSSHRDEPVGRIVVGLPPSLARRLKIDPEGALARSGGNLTVAAKLLGVSRPTLYDLMRQHGLREQQRGD